MEKKDFGTLWLCCCRLNSMSCVTALCKIGPSVFLKMFFFNRAFGCPPGYLISIFGIAQSIDKSMESDNHFKTSKRSRRTDYEFDDLLIMTGGFGRYQMILYAFICLVSIPTGIQLSLPVFYAVSPPFTCAVSEVGNDTCRVGKCCPGCVEYEFIKGTFTSAVSEVRYTKQLS